MEKLQIIAAVILLTALCLIVGMIRKRSLELKYALAWIAVLALALVIDLCPAILNVLSYLSGVATPVNTLFLMAFCFSVVLLFVLTVAVSRLSERIRQLSQAAALNEARLRELLRKAADGQEGQSGTPAERAQTQEPEAEAQAKAKAETTAQRK